DALAGITVHLGPRPVVFFEMIGMQLDQAWKQEVAGEVLGMVRRTAFADRDDDAVRGRDPSGVDHALRKDHASIGYEQTAVRHGYPQAAAVKRLTSMTVSAIAARTSSSCTIATTAVPRRFFSATRSTTTARLPASSEAVGSSSRSSGRSDMEPLAHLPA